MIKNFGVIRSTEFQQIPTKKDPNFCVAKMRQNIEAINVLSIIPINLDNFETYRDILRNPLCIY